MRLGSLWIHIFIISDICISDSNVLLHVPIADFKQRHSLLFSLRLLVSRSHQELTTPKRARMGCGWMGGRETEGEKCVRV